MGRASGASEAMRLGVRSSAHAGRGAGGSARERLCAWQTLAGAALQGQDLAPGAGRSGAGVLMRNAASINANPASGPGDLILAERFMLHAAMQGAGLWQHYGDGRFAESWARGARAQRAALDSALRELTEHGRRPGWCRRTPTPDSPAALALLTLASVERALDALDKCEEPMPAALGKRVAATRARCEAARRALGGDSVPSKRTVSEHAGAFITEHSTVLACAADPECRALTAALENSTAVAGELLDAAGVAHSETVIQLACPPAYGKTWGESGAYERTMRERGQLHADGTTIDMRQTALTHMDAVANCIDLARTIAGVEAGRCAFSATIHELIHTGQPDTAGWDPEHGDPLDLALLEATTEELASQVLDSAPAAAYRRFGGRSMYEYDQLALRELLTRCARGPSLDTLRELSATGERAGWLCERLAASDQSTWTRERLRTEFEALSASAHEQAGGAEAARAA